MEVNIQKCEAGYIISERSAMHGMYGRIWAFSTLKEVQSYLPKIFEPSENVKP